MKYSIGFLLISVVLSFVASSCKTGSTGQEMIEYSLFAKGEPAAADFTNKDGWHVQLTNAQIIFGPLKLCAHVPTFQNKSGDSLTDCGTVMGEYGTASVFDALSSEEQLLGSVTGITGQVHSVAYDYGITWISGQGTPTLVSDDLDGMSVLVEGSATKDGTTVNFRFEMPINPHHEGISTVSGVEAEGDCDSSIQKLVISTDPELWLRYVDFSLLAGSGAEVVQPEQGSGSYNAFYLGVASGSVIDFKWY